MWFAVVFWLTWSFPASALSLSEGAIYVRCHSQFVRRLPAASDPLLIQVKEKKMSAAEACIQLLGETKFDSAGKVAPGRPREVLSTFQDLHSSWFGQRDFIRRGNEFPTRVFYDSNEMGYYLTYGLFGGGRYDDLVMLDHSFRGLRDPQGEPYFGEPGYRSWGETPVGEWRVTEGKGTLIGWRPERVQFGELAGIVPAANRAPARFKGKDGLRFGLSPQTSYGGGVLGVPGFLTMNTNQDAFELSNIDRQNHRRWSKTVFSDLMCRDLPVIRESDAGTFVHEKSGEAFRRLAKCMHCHATLDSMSAAMRNFMEIRLVAKHDGQSEEIRAMAHFSPDLPAAATYTEDDPNYARRPPDGRVIFRSISGELVNVSVNGPREIGKALADTDDFYACAASRYFQFLTGIKVKMTDPSPTPYSSIDRKFLRYRDFVLSLGRRLRKNQSVKAMIADILKSDFYRDDGYGLGHE